MSSFKVILQTMLNGTLFLNCEILYAQKRRFRCSTIATNISIATTAAATTATARTVCIIAFMMIIVVAVAAIQIRWRLQINWNRSGRRWSQMIRCLLSRWW